jgi:purine-binding chemotaxis protein CheW
MRHTGVRVATAHLITRAGKYLTFQLSRQYFAIRSDTVRHIVPASDVHVIPDRLPFFYGTAATNGRLIPVLDLRERLGLHTRPLRATACVVIIALGPACPVTLAGIIADKLSEVVDFRMVEIRGSIAQQRIQGRPYGRPKTLLEPEELLTQEEWAQLRSTML